MYSQLIELDDAIHSALFHIDEALTWWKSIGRAIEDERVHPHLTQARQLLTECYCEELRLRIESDRERLDDAEAAADANLY